jgi:hypothetical protein
MPSVSDPLRSECRAPALENRITWAAPGSSRPSLPSESSWANSPSTT